MTNFQGISAMVFLIVNCAHDKVIIVGDMCVMESSRKRMIMNDKGRRRMWKEKTQDDVIDGMLNRVLVE